MITHTTGFSFLLVLFAACSVLFTCTLVQFASSHLSVDDSLSLFRPIQTRARDDHTYVDDDFPERLLNFDPGDVRMTVEESVRFSIWPAEAPTEWAATSPPGEGSVRLGPDGRVFYLSMFHELHCLQRFQQSLIHDTKFGGTLGHAHHCLNFLRQSSLCAADRTLEEGDFMTRNLSADRVGATHVCKDWGAVYDKVTYDWSRWKDSAASHRF